MIPFIDIHTHKKNARKDVLTVRSLFVDSEWSEPEGYFSIALHPWHAGKLSIEELEFRLKSVSSHKNLLAIGEAGIHKIGATNLEAQVSAFSAQMKFAADNNFPVILHCVRGWQEIIDGCKKIKSIKILHGYSGAPELTIQLLREGFSFSVGEKIFTSEKLRQSLQLIPTDRLFCETDDSASEISDIYRSLASHLGIEENTLQIRLYENFNRLLSQSR